jgi:site-specific recombinase XerD
LERKAGVGLKRACERAGLKPFGWHVLRHTFASHLVMKNKALQVVQQLLGHASIKETGRCAHLSPEMRRDAVGALDELTFASQGRNRGARLVTG